ncbi:MAG: undecaprenyl-diphosphate phosphatase [Candidatus Micrarchaeota archaeon]
MDAYQAILLGFVQGVTEWLPISSSAHLALAQRFFGIQSSIPFDIILHLGTLLAVLAYYRSDIVSILSGILKKDEKSIRIASLIVICAVPTAIIGLLFKDFFGSMFTNPIHIAIALSITGIFLILASGKNGDSSPSAKDALIIGIAQGIAVAPGISRSGATIGTALFLGIDKAEAARFSFLAGVIPILGAAILEGRHAFGESFEPLTLAAGFMAAAVAGYLSIGFFLDILKRSRLHYFGYYCLALAAFVAILTLA